MSTPKKTAHIIPQYSCGPGFERLNFRVKMFPDLADALRSLTENLLEAVAEKPKFDEEDRKAMNFIIGLLTDEVLEVHNV